MCLNVEQKWMSVVLDSVQCFNNTGWHTFWLQTCCWYVQVLDPEKDGEEDGAVVVTDDNKNQDDNDEDEVDDEEMEVSFLFMWC